MSNYRPNRGGKITGHDFDAGPRTETYIGVYCKKCGYREGTLEASRRCRKNGPRQIAVLRWEEMPPEHREGTIGYTHAWRLRFYTVDISARERVEITCAPVYFYDDNAPHVAASRVHRTGRTNESRPRFFAYGREGERIA